jgi:hypothetical protein
MTKGIEIQDQPCVFCPALKEHRLMVHCEKCEAFVGVIEKPLSVDCAVLKWKRAIEDGGKKDG